MTNTPCDPENSVGWTWQQKWPHPGPHKTYGDSAPSADPQPNSARLRKRLHAAAQLATPVQPE